MAVETTDAPDSDGEIRHGPTISIPDESLGTWIAARAEQYGERPAAYRHLGPGNHETLTYDEFFEDACAVAGGLRDLGLGEGDRIGIESETRYEWSVLDVATLLTGVVLVPVYPSFSPSQSAYVIDDAGIDVLVTQEPDVADAVAEVTEEVIDVSSLPEGDFDTDTVVDADPESIATIIYTSGTTGDPKGVELTHRNVVGEMELLNETVPNFDPGKRGTCFLPLSHIYQRVFNYHMWNNGHSAVYMTPDTLLEDLKATEPHILGTVPRVYRRMYDGLTEQVAEMGSPKAQLVSWAIGVARDYGRAIEEGGPGPSPGLRARHAIAERLVYGTLREEFGLTNVEFAITGAASLDAGLLRFFWGLGVPLLEVYGATETTGGVTFNQMESFKPGTVGKPLPNTEVRLAQDGEVLVRGPTIMRGYWNKPDATADSLTDDWYHTGDVGRWNGDFLEIVDRKKHMQVLDTGKNVYSEPIETALRRQDHVAEAMVIAEGQKYVTALLQPNFDVMLSYADAEGIDYNEDAVRRDGDETVAVPGTLLDHPSIQSLFEAEVGDANEDLAEYQTVKKFTLLGRALSVEEDELTPTLKKRRRDIQSNFADRIEEMYDEREA
ncbi:MAG: AMP-dependent synthetase/ligase [Natronomonas sp.]